MSWIPKQRVVVRIDFSDEFMRLNTGVPNGGYHYLGAAKILAPIGKAFAEALVEINAGI